MKDVGGFILIAALVMGLVSLGIVPLKEENKALKQQVSDLETELNQTQQRLIDVLMSNRN